MVRLGETNTQNTGGSGYEPLVEGKRLWVHSES